MKLIHLLLFICATQTLFAQKKPLDHSVYDSWESIGERGIANNGEHIFYVVQPQEGDALLHLRPAGASLSSPYYKIPRGYNVNFSYDGKYAVARIRAPYAATRNARIAKKKAEDMPKDSLAIISLNSGSIFKKARVKSYKLPAKGKGWIAYHLEAVPKKTAPSPTQKTIDSLQRRLDSLNLILRELKQKAGGTADMDAEEPGDGEAGASEGSDLHVRNIETGKELIFQNVADYLFSENGEVLVFRTVAVKGDSSSLNRIQSLHLKSGTIENIFAGKMIFKAIAISADGRKTAFISGDPKTKLYSIFLKTTGWDSLQLVADRNSVGMRLGMTVSEHSSLRFSPSGRRLFFGTVAISPLPDSLPPDIDRVKLDIWHYNDDYLQSQQLFGLNNEIRRNFLAVYNFPEEKIIQLASPYLPNVSLTSEGDGDFFVAVTDTGRRVQAQWSGQTPKDIYSINPQTGSIQLIRRNHQGNVFPSNTGKYVLLYDAKTKSYLNWNGKALIGVGGTIKVPLYNEEADVPNDPPPYGIAGWKKDDSEVYIYDRFDIWGINPVIGLANRITKGRESNVSFRYQKVSDEEDFISDTAVKFLRAFNPITKKAGIYSWSNNSVTPVLPLDNVAINYFDKADKASTMLFSSETFEASPQLHILYSKANNGGYLPLVITNINEQQNAYNWGTAELFNWKAYDGKEATGIVYKPEDFDSTKKYPVLIYFYERLTDGLHSYQAPSPTPSRLNIPFFVSRGYIVFAPDIRYTKGQPGRDAYNYIVSGAKALAKKRWIDGANMGIQGQSWGGYQVAYLITRTDMFKAAWAGAPVVNMFSAYGGIRWESGSNRQFQYERGQSRIGATPWERPDLYIESSPFFHLQKVNTPLVIMSNDADGAVPWYQGIEFFTALRRLNKKVWMLNYNGEAHNLVERKNRKDIQLRQQQYFDWLLKGAAPARWITDGLPAIRKGKEWALETIY